MPLNRSPATRAGVRKHGANHAARTSRPRAPALPGPPAIKRERAGARKGQGVGWGGGWTGDEGELVDAGIVSE